MLFANTYGADERWLDENAPNQNVNVHIRRFTDLLLGASISAEFAHGGLE